MRSCRTLVGLCGWWMGLGVLAETIVLRPVADTSLLAEVPENNLGASPTMVVGGNDRGQPGRGLLRFDVTQHVPPGVVITRVSLAFQARKAAQGTAPASIGAHRVWVEWSEGTGSGNLGRQAIAGECTWKYRSYPGPLWLAPGGSPDSEFSATAGAIVPVSVDGLVEMQSSGLLSDVQLWLANPTQEFGWILRGTSETTALTGWQIATREDADNAPTLTIDYASSPPPVIQRFGRVGDEFQIQFRAEAGYFYEVQFQDRLGGSGTWSVLTNYAAKFFPTNVTVSQSILSSPARVFQIANVGEVD